MIRVEPDFSEMERVADQLGASEKEIRKALNSTLAKMSKWLRSRAVRGLATELNLPQKALSNRVRTGTSQGREMPGRRVWIGLNPVSLVHLKPRQTKKGVRARGQVYPGAFIAPVNNTQQVFQRHGKERYPIDKVMVAMEEKARPFIKNKLIDDQFHQQFYKVFEENLKWHQSRR